MFKLSAASQFSKNIQRTAFSNPIKFEQDVGKKFEFRCLNKVCRSFFWRTRKSENKKFTKKRNAKRHEYINWFKICSSFPNAITLSFGKEDSASEILSTSMTFFYFIRITFFIASAKSLNSLTKFLSTGVLG